jgi:hypothetical protein
VLDEQLEHDVDEARRAYALRGREYVRSFVNRHAPRGSTFSFSDAELEAFNRERSAAVQFWP